MPLPAPQTPPQRPVTNDRREHKWRHVLPHAHAVYCVHCGAVFVAMADLSRGDTGRGPRLRWCGSPDGPMVGTRLPRWCAK